MNKIDSNIQNGIDTINNKYLKSNSYKLANNDISQANVHDNDQVGFDNIQMNRGNSQSNNHSSNNCNSDANKDFGLTLAEQEWLVKNVQEDFEQRRQDRRAYEARWQMNTNFAMGNQYSYVNLHGDVQTEDQDYIWREREVYNHIAPIVETRLAKLGRVRPKMSVRPASGDELDIRAAKVSGKIINSACERMEFDEIVTSATMWSELVGSVFYKVGWDKYAGKYLGQVQGQSVFEGDIRIDVCSPYEIFPDKLFAQTIAECSSIIHARALHIDDIEDTWGKRPQGEELSIINTSVPSATSSDTFGNVGWSKKDDHCVVIERHTRPTKQMPKGEFVIVAGDQLLHYGELPYIIGKNANVDLPFVKQDAIKVAGSFFGVSIIERAIPIQRAYNAVKNRKHEFLNRLSVGVLAVEDGSVDTQSLEDEGLAPGKIVAYKQGSSIPRMLDSGRVPPEFNYEEDRLLDEFITISGVSEIVRNSHLPGSVSSGVAIQLLLEQDDTRLSLTAQSIRVAIRQLAQMVIRMYKQFAVCTRLDRVVGEDGDVELLSWHASDITSDDVIFDTVNELSNTPAAKQNMLFELLKNGLLHNQDGKLSDAMRSRLLDALGYGGWENSQSLDTLHIKRAQSENATVLQQDIAPEDIDKHELHIEIHTAHLLSGSVRKSKDYKKIKTKLMEHIDKHRQYARLEKQAIQMSEQK